jgi:hypothetical protein
MIDRRFSRPDREGFALVTSLLIILVLSLIAVAAVILSTTERRTSFAESVYTTAGFSADAGGEAAIYFLRMCDSPPAILDAANNLVESRNNEALQGDQTFSYACFYINWTHRDGWDPTMFRDYNYRISSSGRAAAGGRSDAQMMASRLFREGY